MIWDTHRVATPCERELLHFRRITVNQVMFFVLAVLLAWFGRDGVRRRQGGE